ncbi:hypothetical protein HDU99_001701, partial [Rhizoclosmatium hyalinum]
LAREQVPVLYICNETSSIVDEKAWFTGRYRNDTVMLASANFGAAKSPMLANMLCSLAKNAPKTLDSFVIWATDIEAAYFLGNISTTSYNSSFGVYYYDVNLPIDFASGDSDNEKYMQLMAGRNAFFERMVSTLGLNFIFTDLDTVFLKDPFVALNIPHGISNVSVTSMDVPEGNTTLGSLFDVVPDLVYSTDARTFFRLMIDPYEGNQRIPKICGGFFFIRSNERTIRLWKHMLEEGLNDQYGIEKLLDDKNSGFDSVMVNPLPAGIEKRKDPRPADEVVNATQVVRVRILSQAAFRNSLPYYEDAGMVGDDYPMLIKELESRGEYEVFYHPNYWIDADVFELPYDNSKNKTLTKRIKHNGNKEEAMKVANQCPLQSNANQQLASNFGRIVTGIELESLESLEPSLESTLKQLLFKHSILVFRGGASVSPRTQLALTRVFDASAPGFYGHDNNNNNNFNKKSVLHPDLKTIPAMPQVQLIGNGFVEEHEGLENVNLVHPHHKTFHRDVVSEDDEERGYTRFYRWHIDAALYDLSPPVATTLHAIKVPKDKWQTVRYDDGTGDELKVPLGATA